MSQRTITIVEHESGRCSMLESYGRESSIMGDEESLAVALVRRPGLPAEKRTAILYEAVRSARRAGFTEKQIAEAVARANTDSDAEWRSEAESEERDEMQCDSISSEWERET